MIIEGGAHEFSGRINFGDNLIVDHAATVAELEQKLKTLLKDFEDLDPDTIQFEHLYDVYALFQHFDYLNMSKVAQRAGINPGLLRQYASQVKYPSKKQAKKIEDTIHALADDMMKAFLFA